MSEKTQKFVLLACVCGLSFMASAPRVRAAVVTGDTFDVAVAGFNSTGLVGALLTAPVDAVFGTTATYTGDALDSQTLTITSSESTVNGLTSDTITISVPTAFIDPTNTKITSNGKNYTISELEFDIGGFNAGTDPLNLSSPLIPGSLTATGSMNYSGGSFTLIPGASSDVTGTQLSAYEGVTYGSQNIGSLDINSFTLTFTYAVPEASSMGAFFGLGGCGLALFARRRR